MNTFWRFFTLPLLLICSYISISWIINPPKVSLIQNNALVLFAAHNLLHSQTLSTANGLPKNTPSISKKNIKPTYYVSPALPFLIATYAVLDSQFKEALSCYNIKRLKCTQIHVLNRYFAIQFLFMALGSMAVFYLAYLLSISWHTALLTLLLFLVGGGLKWGLFPQAWVFQYFTIFTALILIILMHQRKNIFYAFLAGIFFAIACLFESHFIFGLFLIIPLITIALMIEGSWKVHQSLGVGFALICGVFLIAGAWSLRNYHYFGNFWLNPDEAARALSDRISYMQMGMKESLLAHLHFLPSYGAQLGDHFLSTDLKDRLSDNMPTGYRTQRFEIFRSLLNQQVKASLWFSTLIQQYISPAPLAYLHSTPPLFLRSLWGGGSGLLVLAGLFFIPRMLKIKRKRQKLFPLLLTLIVFVSFAAISSLITSTMPQYGLPIYFIYCYAISYVVGCF